MNKPQAASLLLAAALAVGIQAKPPTPAQATYQSMAVRDFIIDGPELAAHQARVQLAGYYIREGNVAMLYPDSQSIVMESRTSVALLLDIAPRSVREAILACDENSITSQLGCGMNIRGHATLCTITNAFGTGRNVACVVIEDGARWKSIAAPTAE